MKIAIISPASIVKPEYIDGAVEYLRSRGLDPVVGRHAKGPADGSFAAGVEQRVADLREALYDPEVGAILCARGGYGCIHLLPYFSIEEVASHPKWLIGFSDVSALHALWHAAGIPSIHGPMAKHLATSAPDDFFSASLLRILLHGGKFDFSTRAHAFDRHGIGRGILRGGNLAVLNSLASTPFDMLNVGEDEDVILFFEDIAEKIYAVERMLSRLCMTGVFHRVRGLIFGRFTDYGTDRNHSSMEEMIHKLLIAGNIRNIPVVFDFPVGHVAANYPLPEGLPVELEANSRFRRLRSIV